MAPLLLLFLAHFLTFAQGSFYKDLPFHAQLLLPGSDAGRHPVAGLSCPSWRLGVETNNLIEWTTPVECKYYVGHYMLGGQYEKDSRVVVDAAIDYAQSLSLPRDARNAWIFDVDETALSHLAYFARHGFGTEPLNVTSFFEYLNEGISPALPQTLRLYNRLLSLGFQIFFLTGRVEEQRDVTAANLKQVGFHTWEYLLLRGPSQLQDTQVEYKSAQREKMVASGYRIWGNIGDQWSDLLGNFTARRSFKLPNPMYYAG